jgi:molecular chaperone GrpE
VFPRNQFSPSGLEKGLPGLISTINRRTSGDAIVVNLQHSRRALRRGRTAQRAADDGLSVRTCRFVDSSFHRNWFNDMANMEDKQASNDAAAEGADLTPGTAGPEGEAQPEQDLAAVQVALVDAQAELAEAKENFLRAKAETENVRRRSQEDVSKAHKFAIESFAEYLLPVIDSLEAALADDSGDAAKVREGVELTLRQLTSALEKGRIVAISPVGDKFDPHRHQAISMVPAEQEPNTVVAVLQKGYLLADRVLRPALVSVAAPK